MSKKTRREQARKLKKEMSKRQRVVRATIKDLVLLLECREKDDYEPIKKTKLYKKHGGEYCKYLELIAAGEHL